MSDNRSRESLLAEIEALKARVLRLEGALDLARQMVREERRHGGEPGNPAIRKIISVLSTKQHATMQMLMSGKSNAEIGERLGAVENTVKVYVRGVLGRFGINRRTQLKDLIAGELELLDDEEYRLMSGGLPRNWDATFSEPDPYKHLYHGRRGK